MGRASTKENKNIFQLCREEAGFTRAAVNDRISWMSESHLEKIESGKTEATPYETIELARLYKTPELCNAYCSTLCEIGKIFVPAVEEKPLPQIVVETLHTLNTLAKEKDRLIEIASDGVVHDNEIHDFLLIHKHLSDISATVDSLQLWIENTIHSGAINKELLIKEAKDTDPAIIAIADNT